ncbi:MAG: hypothetical protein WC343_09230 [Bacilli bacterium]|jgi:hypothetical protein
MDDKIKTWLKTCEIINAIAETEDVHHEELTTTVKNIALQRSGTEDLPLRYVGEKGWKKQYQYMLFLKSESETDLLRLTNLDWLDDLTEWLELQNQDKNYPTLESGKYVEKVSCANALTYQVNDDGDVSVYSLQIYFDIRKATDEESVSL